LAAALVMVTAVSLVFVTVVDASIVIGLSVMTVVVVSVIVDFPPSEAAVASTLISAASPEQAVPHVSSVVACWMPVVLV